MQPGNRLSEISRLTHPFRHPLHRQVLLQKEALCFLLNTDAQDRILEKDDSSDGIKQNASLTLTTIPKGQLYYSNSKAPGIPIIL